jgi:hypothetical protein
MSDYLNAADLITIHPLSSLHTPFVMYHAGGSRESEIYDGRRQYFVEWETQFLA